MRTLILGTLLLFCSIPTFAQDTFIVARDNNRPKALYNVAGVEESVLLKPGGPCDVVALQIYFAGTAQLRDTFYIVGDASEGALPPTSWVWSYNTLAPPLIIQYDGTPGWKTFDIEEFGVRSDGFDRIVVQHRIDAGGLTFVFDESAQTAPYGSFIMNPAVNNSLGLPGQVYLAEGDFMVRLLVRYDSVRGNGSAPPPEPTMIDATREAGLVDGDGSPVRSSRVSVADWNGDGWDDIAAGSRFWQNDGSGSFALVDLGITASTTVWGDYDNDGDLDCYAARGGRNEDGLWRNNGDGTFTDVMEESGLSNPNPTITPTWFDIDLDGDLDLFISNGRTTENNVETYYQDVLWLNDGDGTFTNATVASGVAAAEGAPFYDAWGSTPGDYNDDGLIDIFVATYRLAPDFLYRNEGSGSLTNVAATTGVEGVPTIDPRYFGHGIGAEFADYDNDGDLDLAVGNLGHPDARGQYSNPSLIWRNEGAPDWKFTEVHQELGLKFFEMNTGVVWGDFNLDGFQDLFHAQYAYNNEGENGEPARLSRLYISGGPDEEWRLHDQSWQTGLRIHGTWTAARLDYDNDGDLDLVLASPRDSMRLYRNDLPRKGAPITFRLRGNPGSGLPADGYGTRITVHHGEETYTRELAGGGSGATGTQNSNALHFGIGTRSDNESVDSVVVTWGGTVRHTFFGVATGREYVIRFGKGNAEIEEVRRLSLSVEERGDIGSEIQVVHLSLQSDRLRITLPDESEATLYVEVVGTDGRMILGRAIPFVGRVGELDLPEGLPAGHYFLRAKGEGDRFTGRFEVE